MTAVKIAAHISHLTGTPEECEARGTTLADLIHDLDTRHPGLARYLVQDSGSLRQHVDVWIDDRLISDREKLLDSVQDARIVVFGQTNPTKRAA